MKDMKRNPYYQRLLKTCPNVTEAEAKLIEIYWQEFWHNQEKYKNTDLSEIILEWLKERKE